MSCQNQESLKSFITAWFVFVFCFNIGLFKDAAYSISFGVKGWSRAEVVTFICLTREKGEPKGVYGEFCSATFEAELNSLH